MSGWLASQFHLFPYVIVREEAAQLSFGQWATMIGVTVAREHVDAQGMNLTDIHGSAERSRQGLNKQWQKHIKLSLQNQNLLSIYSFNNLAWNLLFI